MKMHIPIYFLIIFNKYVVASDDSSSNESKYIDLLPEEEKEEFLKSIARRVFEETQTKHIHHKISGEISDDQLNEHSQFVQKILQEETANLRKNDREKNNEKTDDKHDSSESLKVKSLEKDKISIEYENNSDRKDIDFTLQQNISRKKRDRIRDANETKRIHAKEKTFEPLSNESPGVLNNESEVKNSSHIQNNDNVITKLNYNREESDDEDIQVKNVRRKTETFASSKKSSDYVTSSDTMLHFVTQMTDFDETIEENYEDNNSTLTPIEGKTEAPKPIDMITSETEVTTVKSKELINVGFTQSIYESQVQESAENETAYNYQSTDTTAIFEEATTTVVSTSTNVSNKDTKHDDETRRIMEFTTEIEAKKYAVVTGKKSNTKNTEYKVIDPSVIMSPALPTDDVSQLHNLPVNKKRIIKKYYKDKFIKPKDYGYDDTEITQINSAKINKIENTAIRITDNLDDHQLYNLKEGAITHNRIQHYDKATTKDMKNTKTNTFFTTIKPITRTTKIKYMETLTGVTTEIKKSKNNNLTTAQNKSRAQKQDTNSSIIENSLSINPFNNFEEKHSGKDKENIQIDDIVNQKFVNNIVKLLRQGLLSENKSNINNDNPNADNFIGLKSENAKMKEYSVYEISSNQLPFKHKQNNKKVVNEEKNKDQSYYVPIYNYAPNKAYYNANNRLGPNVDDSKSEKDITSAEDSKEISDNNEDNTDISELYGKSLNNQRKFSFVLKSKYPNEMNKKAIYKAKPIILVPKKPQYKEFYYNPEDYLDVDYYYGRMNSDAPKIMRTIIRSKNKQSSISPNSDEDTHPFKNNIKDHIRAVRQVLYEKQRFGFVPPVNISSHDYNNSEDVVDNLVRKVYKHYDEMRTREDNLDNKISKTNNADYYFGLAKIDHTNNNDFEKVGFIKQFGNSKDLYLPVKDFPRGVIQDIKTIQLKTPYEDDNDIRPTVYLPEQSKDVDDNILMVGHDLLKRNNLTEVYVENVDNSKKTYLVKKLSPAHNIGDIKIIKLKNTYIDNGKLIEASRKDKDADEHINTSLLYRSKIFSKYDFANETYGNLDTIKKLLNVTHESDVFPQLDEILKSNINIARTNNISNEIKVYIDVLSDMLKGDNKALKQYDWLATAVDIQAAFKKLFDLTQSFQNGEKMHPSDFQLLKYNIYLLKAADQLMINDDLKWAQDAIARNVVKLPRSKKRQKKYLDKFTLNNGWFLKSESGQGGAASEEEVDVDNFRDFLNVLQEGLYDLHDAIKNIAMVTKYEKQHWLENLKEIYIKFENKQLLDVILHLSTSRMFDLIEESAQNGLEEDYEEYVMNNKEDVVKTLEELTFVLKLLHVIKSYVS